MIFSKPSGGNLPKKLRFFQKKKKHSDFQCYLVSIFIDYFVGDPRFYSEFLKQNTHFLFVAKI
jgi:hypothetical protein